MEIPYAEKPREDTGLYNGKAGIWLFLASEVMLFGALFSAYVLLRVGADPGTWSLGLMNKWVGAFNTLILIASSVTVVLAWICLKQDDFAGFRRLQWWTIIFAAAFLVVKWSYEWPAKFTHYDITFTSNEVARKHMGADLPGGFSEESVKDIWQKRYDPHKKAWSDVELKDKPLDGHIVGYWDKEGKHHEVGAVLGVPFWSKAWLWRFSQPSEKKADEAGTPTTFRKYNIAAIELAPAHGVWDKDRASSKKPRRVAEDHENHKHDGDSSSAHGHNTVKIPREDIQRLTSFDPGHSTFFATYYTMTGLHALHVLGGIFVMLYHLLPISRRVWTESKDRFANRIEITGLFWHFVDLVWIFLFPILYLL